MTTLFSSSGFSKCQLPNRIYIRMPRLLQPTQNPVSHQCGTRAISIRQIVFLTQKLQTNGHGHFRDMPSLCQFSSLSVNGNQTRHLHQRRDNRIATLILCEQVIAIGRKRDIARRLSASRVNINQRQVTAGLV